MMAISSPSVSCFVYTPVSSENSSSMELMQFRRLWNGPSGVRCSARTVVVWPVESLATVFAARLLVAMQESKE